MKSDIIIQLHKNFEDYSHQIDGEEFWFARDLQGLLGYAKWENFAKVIDKAKIACQTAGHDVSDHFPDVRKMIRNVMSCGLAGYLGLVDNLGKVLPLGISEKSL